MCQLQRTRKGDDDIAFRNHAHVLNSSPSASKSLSRLRLTIGIPIGEFNSFWKRLAFAAGPRERTERERERESLVQINSDVLAHHHDVHEVPGDSGDGAAAEHSQGASFLLSLENSHRNLRRRSAGRHVLWARGCDVYVQCGDMMAF